MCHNHSSFPFCIFSYKTTKSASAMPYSIADTPSYQLLLVYNFIYLFTIIIYDKLLSYQFCQILCGIFYTEQTAVDQDITMIDVPRLISGIIRNHAPHQLLRSSYELHRFPVPSNSHNSQHDPEALTEYLPKDRNLIKMGSTPSFLILPDRLSPSSFEGLS